MVARKCLFTHKGRERTAARAFEALWQGGLFGQAGFRGFMAGELFGQSGLRGFSGRRLRAQLLHPADVFA